MHTILNCLWCCSFTSSQRKWCTLVYSFKNVPVGRLWWFFTGLMEEGPPRVKDKTQSALTPRWQWVLTLHKLQQALIPQTTAMSHKNKDLLSGWVRLSAILNSSSFSSAVALQPSSLDRVTLRSPGPEPTWSSTLVSCTTTDTSPLPQAALSGETEDCFASVAQEYFHCHFYSVSVVSNTHCCVVDAQYKHCFAVGCAASLAPLHSSTLLKMIYVT